MNDVITLGQVKKDQVVWIPQGSGKHRGKRADDGCFVIMEYIRHIDGHHVFLAATHDGPDYLFADSLMVPVLTHG